MRKKLKKVQLQEKISFQWDLYQFSTSTIILVIYANKNVNRLHILSVPRAPDLFASKSLMDDVKLVICLPSEIACNLKNSTW